MAQDSAASYALRTDTAAIGRSVVGAIAENRVADPSPDSQTVVPWLTSRDAAGAGIAVAATIAAVPLDRPVSRDFREPRWQRNRTIHNLSRTLAFTGGPAPFLLGAGLFAVGEASESQATASVGVHVTESVLLAASVTAVGKGIAGRALPGVQTKEAFEWARGFHRGNGPFVSFPSGHTAAAFALASALTGETAYWHPALRRYVEPTTYIAAAAVGLSRLYENVHWASDLPLGAAIGTWAGVTIEDRAHPHRRHSVVQRIAAATSVGRSVKGSTMLSWSFPLAVQRGEY